MTKQSSIIPGSPAPEGDPGALTLVTSRSWPMKRRRAAPDLQLDTATLCRDRDRDRGQHQSRAGGDFSCPWLHHTKTCAQSTGQGTGSSGFQLLEHVQLSLKTGDVRVSVAIQAWVRAFDVIWALERLQNLIPCAPVRALALSSFFLSISRDQHSYHPRKWSKLIFQPYF